MQRSIVQRMLLIALLGIATLSSAQDENEVLAEHFRAGQQAAAQQQFTRAIAEFRAVLKLDPSLIQARANLGLMYYSSGKFDDAVTELLKVVHSDPSLLVGQLFLGLSYLNTGKPELALAPLRKALQIDSGNREGRRALLLCYLEQNKYVDATEQIAILEKQSSDEETLYTIGQAYLDMGRSATSDMAKQYRNSAWAHRLAGDLAVDRGDWPVALQAYRQVLALDPKMFEVRAALAGVLRQVGNTDEAAVEGAASSQAPVTLPLCQLNQLIACEELLEKRPGPEVYYRLIRADTALGNTYLEKLQRFFPDSARAYQLRAKIDRLRQNFPAALEEFQAASQKRPDDAELHRDTGEMLLLLDRVSEAADQLQKAEELNPGNVQTEYLLAQVALKKKDTETAILDLKKALQRDPGLTEVHALLGTAYMHVDRPALAVVELEKAQSIDYHGDLSYQLFKAYRALGNNAAAEKALARSKERRKSSLQSAVSRIAGDNAVADQEMISQ